MASTLLDHLRLTFTSAAVNTLARTLGQETAPTQKAIDGLLPTLSAGVTNLAETEPGMSRLYDLLQRTPFAHDPSLDELAQTSDHRQKAAQTGNSLLASLFEDRPERLAAAVATYSGVSSGAATTLTGLVMSVLMGYLHEMALTKSQLTVFLASESAGTLSAVPGGLASLLGWFLGTGRPRTVVRSETASRPVETPVAASTPWWRRLLYILVPVLVLLLLLRYCNRDKTAIPASEQTSGSGGAVATDTIASDLNGNGPDSATTAPQVRVGVDLPGGRKLNVTEYSFNYSLAKFLSTKGGQLPKVFTFDNLTFETNSAQITAQARPYVDELLQIMQAYPTLAIRIEGNTDSTGDEAINDPLSGERAEAVKQALLQGGIDASRVTTRERGDTKPVAPNTTPAGREKNRRIDVVVTHI